MEWKILNNIIKDSNSFVLSTHINPDGDGLGSQLAFYYYLKDMGKECKIINHSPLPPHYKFLDSDKVIEQFNKDTHEKYFKKVDVAIIFDIGDCKRLESVYYELKSNNSYIVSIDHHPSKNDFFDHCFVDLSMPATGYMVWDFLMYSDYKDIPIKAAEGLYCALITDTGSFRYNSTTSECHEMASHLLSLGVKPYDIYSRVYERREIPQILLLSLAINKIKFYSDGEFAGYVIDQKLLEKANAKHTDVEGFTDFVRSIKGVEVAFMILEQRYDFRINLRSRGKYIIRDIAEHFGGGGHKLAAGATIKNISIEKIESKIVDLLNRKKKRNGN
jgi:phosphoesterase RecJ-like protein